MKTNTANPSGEQVSRSSSVLRGNLRYSVVDAVAFGVMVGVGETYLAAYALAAGLGEFNAALVGSVPVVVGGLMQAASPYFIRRLASHRTWVVICSGLQALSLLLLALGASAGTVRAWSVLALAGMYWGCGQATGPAWNSWIGTLVPVSVRSAFFSRRTRASQFAVLIGFGLGGLALHRSPGHTGILNVYAALFALAAIARLTSAWALSRHSEPVPMPSNVRPASPRVVIRLLHQHSGGRLLIYLAAAQAAVQIAGPFFTPYMFEELRFSYAEFMMVVAVAYLSKAAVFPWWGRVAGRIGAAKVLWIGAVGICPLSACWLFTDQFAVLLAVQIVGGVFWAAYELAFFLLFFESIPEEERTLLLTAYNFINSIAWVSGALGGAAILALFRGQTSGYLVIFATSAVARITALILLLRVSGVTIPRAAGKLRSLTLRTIALRPNSAGIDVPVTTSYAEEPAAANDDSAR